MTLISHSYFPNLTSNMDSGAWPLATSTHGTSVMPSPCLPLSIPLMTSNSGPQQPEMVWCGSPHFLCSITETACNIISKLFDVGNPLHPHPFDHIML